MSETRFREEVHNILLANCLEEKGIVTLPEILENLPEGPRRMPDVLVEYQGLRTIIEGKVNDSPNARKNVERDANDRIEEGLAQIGIAVLYPKSLRSATSTAELFDLISSRKLEILIISEAGIEGWSSCYVKDISDLLRRVFENLVEQRVIDETKAIIEVGVNSFSKSIIGSSAIIERSAKVLGIYELQKKKGKVKKGYNLKEKEAICKISALTIINAMIFQDILSSKRGDVDTIGKSLVGEDIASRFADHWQYITEEINYVPIFQIARELMLEFPSNPEIYESIRFLGKQAQTVLRKRAIFRHDLMGRVYHTLLADKKYLATYYTSVPAATILLKLALTPKSWKNIDWSTPKKLADLRIGDIACGTGTLLMAASEALTDNYVHACVEKNKKINLDALHQVYMEDILYGYDVLTSALHLTASTLALRSSSVSFTSMNLFVLPHGGNQKRLGSIDFLKGQQVEVFSDAFHSGATQVVEKGSKAHYYAPLPKLDLCIMNPPYTRSVGGNLLFGSLPDKERRAMQNELARLIRESNLSANSTAGLGAVFIAVADRFIKTSGRIALVLQKTMLSGVAWKKTRELLSEKYVVEYIISSHDPLKWNFSDSTDQSEVLLIARKVGDNNGDYTNSTITKYINLWNNPATVASALTCARVASQEDGGSLVNGHSAFWIESGDKMYGEIVNIPWREIKDGLWMLPAAFAYNSLTRVAIALQKGVYKHPRSTKSFDVPMVPLNELGDLGPDRRDIYDGFKKSLTKTDYPTYWGHDTKTCTNLIQEPNGYLEGLTTPQIGRNLRDYNLLWKSAGNILIAERSRMNTQRIIAGYFTNKVLSNVWWAFKASELSDDQRKVLVLWLNSTPGILMLLSIRGETQGAWVDFKKPNLSHMQVLDVRKLSSEQIEILSTTFDEVCNEPIKPFPEMESDIVRIKMDNALEKALGINELEAARKMLAIEPVICLRNRGGESDEGKSKQNELKLK